MAKQPLHPGGMLAETHEQPHDIHTAASPVAAAASGTSGTSGTSTAVPAHSPGDAMVWIPDQKLVISGDMAFHERMLPIFDDTDTAAWLETWEAFEALGAVYVIPGHGHPTNMDQVRRYTKDYLVDLRDKIREHIDNGGDLKNAYYVDQSDYKHLDTYEELATRNAGRVYEQMEFE